MFIINWECFNKLIPKINSNVLSKKERKHMEKLKKFLKDEDGVTALEYTVLAALVIIVIVGFFTPIKNSVSNIWVSVNSALTLGS